MFIVRSSLPDDDTMAAKRALMDQHCPGWRTMLHDNGKPKFSSAGTMLDAKGNRSIFDDVDE